ncbi:MAG TPA: glycerate kinase [Candidatus Acetothermia bacterium]|nr:glycerate kinase [Candidatus Acetothermia bacterium]
MIEAARLRRTVTQIMEQAIASVDPRSCVKRVLAKAGDGVQVGTHSFPARRVVVVGFGKAAGTMAQAVEGILEERVEAGLVVTADGYGVECDRIEVVEASHPVPDSRGVQAARRIASIVDAAGEDDLVLVLISGGGSSLLMLPADGLTLDHLRETNELLLRSGAPIQAVNAVRKHLDQLKGGQLARRCAPAQVVSLILSDVPGDPLHVIASGPTVPDPTTFLDAHRVLQDYELWDRVPEAVRTRFARGLKGAIPETPKPGDPLFRGVYKAIVGSGVTAAEAALGAGERLGFTGLILTTELCGEAREVGQVVASLVREMVRWGRPVPRPGLLVLAGETTVTVRGSGRGGRNQEAALAAALGIAELEDVVVCFVGTDGQDGPTDAAGGLVDGGSVGRMAAGGVDPRAALLNNDAYGALSASGDLVVTGPTGTNVADLCLVAIGARS